MLSPKFERLLALIQKEWLQVFRDPSALLVAFVLPIIMLFIFGFGLSFDAKHVKIGIALEDRGSSARAFWNTFDATEYFDAAFYGNRSDAEQALADGDASFSGRALFGRADVWRRSACASRILASRRSV